MLSCVEHEKSFITLGPGWSHYRAEISNRLSCDVAHQENMSV